MFTSFVISSTFCIPKKIIELQVKSVLMGYITMKNWKSLITCFFDNLDEDKFLYYFFSPALIRLIFRPKARKRRLAR
jgi:hypothetical protein